MYNEQIEALISAALADGVLTEKEKQILFKKAESMGIDLDEFEMILDARLVELKKKEAREEKQYELEMEKAKAAQKSAPKSNKFGDVRKCPTCGAMVESFQTKCPECGYEFTNIEANSTTQKLLDALDAVNAQTTNQGIVSVLSGLARAYGYDSATMRKCQIIQNFPVPNTKEDLIEMLSLAHTNAETKYGDNVDEQKMHKAWKRKEKLILEKADLMIKDDPDYIALKESWKKKKRWGLF